MKSSVDWEEQYQRYMDILENWSSEEFEKIAKRLHSQYENPDQEELIWFKRGLQTSKSNVKYFIAMLATEVPVLSEKLFPLLMRAAIDDDPSFNRRFLEPCMLHFGSRRVHEYLLEVFETGTPFEQAGAVNATYWASVPVKDLLDMSAEWNDEEDTDEYLEKRNEEDKKWWMDLTDIWERWKNLLLEQFITNKSVEVQRSIISKLSFNAKLYPETHRPLVPKALQIARSHPDAYIRHRVGVQLGTETTLKALPHRQRFQQQEKSNFRNKLRKILKK